MYPVLALLLLALAAFTVLALGLPGRTWPPGLSGSVRSRRHLGGSTRPGGHSVDSPVTAHAARETLDGFALVGGAGLVVVAVAVLVIGSVTTDNGIADLIAMIAFFAYLIFVSVALVLARRAR